jgi:hypothetical protein
MHGEVGAIAGVINRPCMSAPDRFRVSLLTPTPTPIPICCLFVDNFGDPYAPIHQ